MKVLLLMVLFSVVYAMKPVPYSKDYSELHGVWYVKAWVGNVDIPEDKKHEKIPAFTIRPITKDKMEAKLNLRKNGRCEEIKLSLERTNQPGKLLTWGRQTVNVLDMDMAGYLISYIESKMNGKNIMMMELMGRKPEMNPQAFQIFKDFVKSKGHDPEQIIIPEIEVNCATGQL
ncbi:lipocalin-1-like [Gracilinanus agilis]|uniref:lipocalin-1-like n=1 Tax=Gracilinanus agilis TaxID=191870 RepID=UPI001CFD25D5|nr:lipocalin-1-like [Gracilinanus agilis]